MSETTPMLQQYLDIKSEYKDCILLFRLGDFYEMFGDDARVASELLGITLTSREAGKGNRIPMCGVPYHAANSYIARLVKAGHRAAICEQLEDPSQAKGIVRREVIKVVTPGTVIDEDMIDSFDNNFIAAISVAESTFGLSWMDVSTGEFYATIVGSLDDLVNEVHRVAPAEIVMEDSRESNFILGRIMQEFRETTFTPLDAADFAYDTCYSRLCAQFGVEELTGAGPKDAPEAISASGALLAYVQRMQRAALTHVSQLTIQSLGQYMELDRTARRNLELTARISDGQKKGSLLSVLDRTRTAMGGRALRQWLERPLMSIDEINSRLAAVEELSQDFFMREGLVETLSQIQDLERLVGRVCVGNASPKDLVALASSLERVELLKKSLSAARAGLIASLAAKLDDLPELVDLIRRAIVDDPPATIKDGGVIRHGFNAELDEIRQVRNDGQAWIANLESEERERTGIRSLKVGYNQVFGYYIEVTKPNLALVPKDYIRKQTLVNTERYVTEQLKEYEQKILSAEERYLELERSLFDELVRAAASSASRIQATAASIGAVDALVSLAAVAVERHYVRPDVTMDRSIDIREGRHPVVETMQIEGGFVPNDTFMDSDSDQILIITGPNMAGKSTYMRQVALIVIMAQMGSFVPAGSASIGLVDQIFTRIGASDDLASGRSTFMVEMSEVSDILRRATPRSLVLLDEVGRGTSTFDGISIAWSVVEYLHEKRGLRCKTLFATHYHELTALESVLERVRNLRVDVSESATGIVFLRKIVRGGADRSYGIEVARLAGLPSSVISRAREIQAIIEGQGGPEANGSEANELGASPLGASGLMSIRGVAVARPPGHRSHRSRASSGPSLFDFEEHALIRELASLDCLNMSPMVALERLYDLQQRAKAEVERWEER